MRESGINLEVSEARCVKLAAITIEEKFMLDVGQLYNQRLVLVKWEPKCKYSSATCAKESAPSVS